MVVSCDGGDGWVDVQHPTLSPPSPRSPPLSSPLAPRRPGTAVCTYTALISGNNILHIKLDGNDVVDSPYTVFVDEGPLKASTSTAEGKGLRVTEAGEMGEFTITARDHRGNLRTDDAGKDG